MSAKALPASIGSYRIIRPSELTEAQRAILRAASRRQVHDRLVALLGQGRVLASDVQARYGALMAEVGHA